MSERGGWEVAAVGSEGPEGHLRPLPGDGGCREDASDILARAGPCCASSRATIDGTACLVGSLDRRCGREGCNHDVTAPSKTLGDERKQGKAVSAEFFLNSYRPGGPGQARGSEACVVFHCTRLAAFERRRSKPSHIKHKKGEERQKKTRSGSRWRPA